MLVLQMTNAGVRRPGNEVSIDEVNLRMMINLFLEVAHVIVSVSSLRCIHIQHADSEVLS